MILKKWEDLPERMKNDSVRPYYELLSKKKTALVIKRAFDVSAASAMLVILSPLFIGIGAAVKLDSPGPAVFKQTRVTQYGRKFTIYKFRTMVDHAEKLGTAVTADHDQRITRLGKMMRKYRLDELPQLVNILFGDMSFVGTRPEVVRYVKNYTDEMTATLLLPAGVTSEASIKYKDEEKLLDGAQDVDEIYTRVVLPQKMAYNLKGISNFGLIAELKIMIETILAVIR